MIWHNDSFREAETLRAEIKVQGQAEAQVWAEAAWVEDVQDRWENAYVRAVEKKHPISLARRVFNRSAPSVEALW